MRASEAIKIIESKGGKHLPNRTKVKNLAIGDYFKLRKQPHWKKEYMVLFFYLDKVFDMVPFICGIETKTKDPIFISYTATEKIIKLL